MSILATALLVARNPIAQALALGIAAYGVIEWQRYDAAADARRAEQHRSAVEALSVNRAAGAARREAESDAAAIDLVELCVLNSAGGERMRDECERDIAKYVRSLEPTALPESARAAGGAGAGGGPLFIVRQTDRGDAGLLAQAWSVATWLALTAAAVGAGLYVRRRFTGVAHEHSPAAQRNYRTGAAGGRRSLRSALAACRAAIVRRAARARRRVGAAVVAAVAALGLRRGTDSAGDPDRPGRWRWGAVARRLRGIAGAIASWTVAAAGMLVFLMVTADVARDAIERRVAYVVREGVQPVGVP